MVKKFDFGKETKQNQMSKFLKWTISKTNSSSTKSNSAWKIVIVLGNSSFKRVDLPVWRAQISLFVSKYIEKSELQSLILIENPNYECKYKNFFYYQSIISSKI